MTGELESLTGLLLKQGLMVATAESCTAGLVAKMLTDQAGSSQWFERGFVTYSNRAKRDMLGVAEKTLAEQGAVSEQAVIEMVNGALQNSEADVAIAISGIAGPEGGTEDKPVGTVWFAWAGKGRAAVQEKRVFPGNRDEIRQQAAGHALRGLLDYLSK